MNRYIKKLGPAIVLRFSVMFLSVLLFGKLPDGWEAAAWRGVVWLVPIYTPLLYCELGWGEITLETTRHVTIETKVVPWISLEYKGYERWAQGAREHKETIRGERRRFRRSEHARNNNNEQ